MERPLCSCHGQPMRLNRDKRYTGGSYWRCAVKDRVDQQTRYARDPQAQRDRVRRYGATARGYTTRRRRDLAGQRTRILEQLAQLEQEAVTPC